MRCLTILTIAALSLGSFAQAQTAYPLPTLGGITVNLDGGVRVQIPSSTPLSGDPYTSPEALLLGGSGELLGASLGIQGLPYGPLDLGVQLSVTSSDRTRFGNRAGIAPNGPDQINTYGDFDSANVNLWSGSNPPYFVASSGATLSDGQTHSVTYSTTADANGNWRANFTPPLPAYEVSLLRPSMHVMTNSLDGVTRCHIGRNGYCDPQGRVPLGTYGGQIVAWDPAGSWVAVGTGAGGFGWAVPGGGSAVAGQVPGKNYDTVHSNFGAAALMFGVYTNTDNILATCAIQNGQAPNGINDPKGTVGNQVHSCHTAEFGNWNYDTTDYLNSFYGVEVTYNPIGLVPNTSGGGTHPVMPTDDSHAFLCGGNFPTCFDADEAPNAVSFRSNAVMMKGYADNLANGNPTSAVGDRALMMELSKTMDLTHLARLSFYSQRTSALPGGLGTSAHENVISDIVDGNLFDPNTGTVTSSIVFPHDGTLRVCTQSGNCVVFDAAGNEVVTGTLTASQVLSNGNIVTGSGGALITKTSAGTTGATIASDSVGNAVIGTGIAGGGGIRLVGSSGPTITTGTGAPTGTAPNASLYIRQDGSTGARIYVSTGSAWTAIPGV